MQLFCGCQNTCLCEEEFRVPVTRPNTPVDKIEIDMTSNPNTVSRSTQTQDSIAPAIVRVEILRQLYANDHTTKRILNDIKHHLLL